MIKIKSKNGNKVFEVLEKMPNGYKETKGTLTQPIGTIWVDNNKSIFGGERKQFLVVVNKELFLNHIKTDSSRFELIEQYDNLEYHYNETLESEDFDGFIVLSQSYDLVNLDTDESKEIFNVAIEVVVDSSYSRTIDLFESYNQSEVDAFYDNLIKNINKVGKTKWNE